MGQFIDITGNRYNRLVVLKEVLPRVTPIKWVVLCDCGTVKEVVGKDLKNGKIQSCGCYKIERTKEVCTTHGATCGGMSRLYRIWAGMLQRVTNPNREFYEDYMGRGITVCDEWLHFEPFQQWALTNGYDAHLKIERINNDLGYFPDNCTWETSTIQARNRRPRKGSSSKFIGISKTSSNKWIARIYLNNTNVYLGIFTTEEEAALARDSYIINNKLKSFTLNILER